MWVPIDQVLGGLVVDDMLIRGMRWQEMVVVVLSFLGNIVLGRGLDCGSIEGGIGVCDIDGGET